MLAKISLRDPYFVCFFIISSNFYSSNRNHIYLVAIAFSELQEESSGLKQDWLSLNNVLDQLKTRKQNLEIL